MRRRSRAGGEPVKTRRRKTVTLKRRNAPKVARHRGSSADGLSKKVALFKRERDEALEQQKATAEILRVIRTSPAEVQPVFETIVRNAVSLCGSLYAIVFRFDGELLHFVASHQSPAPGASVRERHLVDSLKTKYPMRPNSSQVAGRVLLTKSVVRLEDALNDPDYDQRFARVGFRRVLGVPMLREGDPLGVIVASWAEAGPVPKVQEELLKTFADQAVIAIENVRLFDAEQQRTRELSESFQQQTATADVLKVISRSTFDLQTMLDTLVKSAARLCAAERGVIFQRDGDLHRLVANYGFSREAEQYAIEHPLPADRGSVTGRVALEGRAIHIPDVLADPEFHATGYQKTFGFRTILGVPVLREGTTIGVFALTRLEVKPFTDKQIELVTTFADQAAIAIENTRLLNELRQRTTDLTESLEQQTATADVLKVISRSTFDLQTVLRAHLYFIREGIACAAASVCSEEFLVQRVYPRCKVFAQSAHFAPNHYKLYED